MLSPTIRIWRCICSAVGWLIMVPGWAWCGGTGAADARQAGRDMSQSMDQHHAAVPRTCSDRLIPSLSSTRRRMSGLFAATTQHLSWAEGIDKRLVTKAAGSCGSTTSAGHIPIPTSLSHPLSALHYRAAPGRLQPRLAHQRSRVVYG